MPNHHDDHIARKGDNLSQPKNLVHKFIPLPQAVKIAAAKSSGGKGMGQSSENFGVELDESQKQIRGDR